MSADAAIRAALDRWCAEPFVWGRSDCLLALADIVKDWKGYDPARKWRNRYTTARGALRVTKDVGFFEGALREAAHCHQWVPVDPRAATSGDIGFVRAPRPMGAIRLGAFWVARRDACGFGHLPRVDIAWRLP